MQKPYTECTYHWKIHIPPGFQWPKTFFKRRSWWPSRRGPARSSTPASPKHKHKEPQIIILLRYNKIIILYDWWFSTLVTSDMTIPSPYYEYDFIPQFDIPTFYWQCNFEITSQCQSISNECADTVNGNEKGPVVSIFLYGSIRTPSSNRSTLNTQGSLVKGLMPLRAFVAARFFTTNLANPCNMNWPRFFNSPWATSHNLGPTKTTDSKMVQCHFFLCRCQMHWSYANL